MSDFKYFKWFLKNFMPNTEKLVKRQFIREIFLMIFSISCIVCLMMILSHSIKLASFKDATKDYDTITVKRGEETYNPEDIYLHFTYEAENGKTYDVMGRDLKELPETMTLYVNKKNNSDYLYRPENVSEMYDKLNMQKWILLGIWLFVIIVECIIEIVVDNKIISEVREEINSLTPEKMEKTVKDIKKKNPNSDIVLSVEMPDGTKKIIENDENIAEEMQKSLEEGSNSESEREE